MDIIKQPCVSVIVPCYNAVIYLQECLDSVLDQTYTNWECIVVDNASTDNSKEIAEQYVQKDKRFRLIYHDIKGVSSARNKGITCSSGKYILPLDADDKISATYLQKAISILENNDKIKVVYCDAELFGHMSGKWNLPEFSLNQMLIENAIFCAALFRRADFNKTTGYNESMITGFEDWDFWLSLITDDSEVYKIPEVLFYYRIKKDSRNNSLDNDQQKILRRKIYENHKKLYDSRFIVSDLIFEYYVTKNKYTTLINSPDYSIGRSFLAPIRFFQKLLKK
jgi:glycosyltransferase involved in cell wall biosynthesis